MPAFLPVAPSAHHSVAYALALAAHPFAILGLTPRECEVLTWLTEAKRDSEIARILGVSVRTIEHHVGSILLKLEVETRTAAACRGLALLLARASSPAAVTPKAA